MRILLLLTFWRRTVSWQRCIDSSSHRRQTITVPYLDIIDWQATASKVSNFSRPVLKLNFIVIRGSDGNSKGKNDVWTRPPSVRLPTCRLPKNCHEDHEVHTQLLHGDKHIYRKSIWTNLHRNTFTKGRLGSYISPITRIDTWLTWSREPWTMSWETRHYVFNRRASELSGTLSLPAKHIMISLFNILRCSIYPYWLASTCQNGTRRLWTPPHHTHTEQVGKRFIIFIVGQRSSSDFKTVDMTIESFLHDSPHQIYAMIVSSEDIGSTGQLTPT